MRIITTDRAELALRRVHRGVNWLDENGPPRWRLNLISIHDGVVSCKVHTVCSEENAIALALRDDPQFISHDTGYVSWGIICEAFGWNTRPKIPIALGFAEHSFDDAKEIDAAWKKALSNFYEPSLRRFYPEMLRAT